jgi:hypothetical protein
MLAIERVGDGIEKCMRGQGLMECGVEDRHLREVGKGLAEGTNSGKVRGVVEWGPV